MDALQTRMDINEERYIHLVQIKTDYLEGKLSLEEGNQLLKEKLGTVTPDEFAFAEQTLKGSYQDEVIVDRMDDLLALFDGVLIRAYHPYEGNHPLAVYRAENEAMVALLGEVEGQLLRPWILNEWLGLFDLLNTWHIHLSRKQNQLYPMLEKYGFDRPTKIMWTFDDAVRDSIKETYALLEGNQREEFLAAIPKMVEDIRDLCHKELEVLLPTAYKVLQEADFVELSKSDHEIGFSLIDVPTLYGITEGVENKGVKNNFLADLASLMGKYKKEEMSEVLDVATGKLTLEQINLLFKHMPVDLSYVDEHELVAFYSDTKHRIFPRSASVIGREVVNCHPPHSVHVVKEIIEKFRSGEEDQVDFWINKPNMFIYVLYTAVRDEQGNFRGVLEMMQDATRIRSLEDSRTLLTWEKKEEVVAEEEMEQQEVMELTPKTVIGDIIKAYPKVVDVLSDINPMFGMINTIMGKQMAKVATLEMMAYRADLPVETLIEKLQEFIAGQE